MIEVLLKDLGYSEKAIKKINNSHFLSNYEEQHIISKINQINKYLKEKLNYTKEEIIRITSRYPNIYTYSIENINNKVNYYLSNGYKVEEFKKMLKTQPGLLGPTLNTIIEREKFLLSLGYSKRNISKMLKLNPNIYVYSKDNINDKLKYLESLGYSKEEVLLLTTKLPSLFSYDKYTTIEPRFNNIINCGYSINESLNIVKCFPQVLGLKEENTKEKIEFYNKIGIHDAINIRPMYLMQNIELSYARYKYLSDNKIDLNIKNHTLLFKTKSYYKERYGLTSDSLLKMYPYNNIKKKEK